MVNYSVFLLICTPRKQQSIMKDHIRQALNSKEPGVLILASLVFLCGLFIHLGNVPLMSDEGIRGLVALEMQLSGDYLTPTINGELYFNKPPLYNWIILAFFKLTGSHSLFILRLPTIIATLFFTMTIFLYVRRYFGDRFAAFNALLFLSTGKILFSDTNLALIDLTHSWLLYLNFIVILEFSRRHQPWKMFLISYGLIALCYLMKGFPALVAQAATLLAFFIARKEFRKLFSLPHVTGIILMTGIIGAYYYFYIRQNPGILEHLFAILWDQSAQRTVARYPWEKTVAHLVLFPLKFLYELLPVSLLVVACLRKDFIKRIHDHPVLFYSFLFLVANSLIYWLSPYWRVRYIFMLFPLAVTIMLYFHLLVKEQNRRLLQITGILLSGISAIATLALILAPFLDAASWKPANLLINFIIAAVMILIIAFMIKRPALRLALFVLLLSVGRLAVSVLYLPVYSQMQKEYRHRDAAIEIGRTMRGKEVYLYGNQHINEDISYYITRETGQILRHRNDRVPGEIYYIADNRILRDFRQKGIFFSTAAEFYTRNEGVRLYLIRFL